MCHCVCAGLQGLSSVEQEHVDARLGPSRFLQFLSANNISASTLNLSLNSSSSTNSTPHVAVAFSGGGVSHRLGRRPRGNIIGGRR